LLCTELAQLSLSCDIDDTLWRGLTGHEKLRDLHLDIKGKGRRMFADKVFKSRLESAFDSLQDLSLRLTEDCFTEMFAVLPVGMALQSLRVEIRDKMGVREALQTIAGCVADLARLFLKTQCPKAIAPATAPDFDFLLAFNRLRVAKIETKQLVAMDDSSLLSLATRLDKIEVLNLATSTAGMTSFQAFLDLVARCPNLRYFKGSIKLDTLDEVPGVACANKLKLKQEKITILDLQPDTMIGLKALPLPMSVAASKFGAFLAVILPNLSQTFDPSKGPKTKTNALFYFQYEFVNSAVIAVQKHIRCARMTGNGTAT
jgi:hypothetical protein